MTGNLCANVDASPKIMCNIERFNWVYVVKAKLKEDFLPQLSPHKTLLGIKGRKDYLKKHI